MLRSFEYLGRWCGWQDRKGAALAWVPWVPTPAHPDLLLCTCGETPLSTRVGCFLKGRKGSWGGNGILTLPGGSELLGMAKPGEQGERVW